MFKLGDTGDDLSLDAALVVSSSDLEESLISPALVPAVGDEPVGSAVLNSPADDLDGVAAEGGAADVVVDSGLVGEEVVVDGEGSLDGAVGHDFGLDLGDLGRDGVDGVGEPVVVGIGSGVAVGAGLGALGSGLGGAAGSVLAGGVMVALLEEVGAAPLAGVVEPSGDNAALVPIVEGARGVTSVAAVSATNAAAGQQVLSRDSGLEFLAAGDADTVTHGLDGAERPAGPAGALVTNLLDGVALGPGLSGGELVGDVLEGLEFLEGELEVLGGLEGAHEALDGLEIHAVEVVVVASLPGGLLGVDVVDDGLEVQEGALALGNGRHGKEAQQQHCEGLHQRDQLSILQTPPIYTPSLAALRPRTSLPPFPHYLFMRGIKLHSPHKPHLKIHHPLHAPLQLPATVEDHLANASSCRSYCVKAPAGTRVCGGRQGSQAESIKAAIHKLRTESPQFSELGFMQSRSRSYFFERTPKPRKPEEKPLEVLLHLRTPQRRDPKHYLPELALPSPHPHSLHLPSSPQDQDGNVILLKRNMRYRLQKLPNFERAAESLDPQLNMSVTAWHRNPEESEEFGRQL